MKHIKPALRARLVELLDVVRALDAETHDGRFGETVGRLERTLAELCDLPGCAVCAALEDKDEPDPGEA